MIYKVNYEDYKLNYIGHTSTSLKTTIYNHKINAKPNTKTKSARFITPHTNKT